MDYLSYWIFHIMDFARCISSLPFNISFSCVSPLIWYLELDTDQTQVQIFGENIS